MTLSTLWYKLSHTGTQYIADEQKRKITLNINRISLITAILCVIFGPTLSLILKTGLIVYPALFEATLFLLVILLNKSQNYNFAKIGFFTIHNMAVIYFAVLFGKNVDVYLMVFFLVGMAYLVFDGYKVVKRICVLVTVVGITFLEINYHYNSVGYLFIPKEKELLIRGIAFAVILFLDLLVLEYYTNAYLHLTEKLRRHAEEKENAYNVKAQSVNIVSHALRNEMQPIVSIVEKLKMELPAGERIKAWSLREPIDDLHHASFGLIESINEVLDHSKLEARKQESPILRPVAIRGLIKEKMKLLQYFASKKGVLLEIEISDDLPTFLLTDKMRLVSIIKNLVINAIKFTKNSTKVTIILRKEVTNWLLSVEDQGDGIPSDKVDQIFDEFVSKSINFASGTGLGLTITKKYVEDLHGFVYVEHTKLGEGSRFTARFPLIPCSQDLLKEEELSTANDHAFDDLKLLLVDDNAMSLKYLAHYLSRLRFQVILAENGSRALELAEKEIPDIIILDMELPGMSGLEVITRIRKNAFLNNTKIIVSTGSEEENVRETVLAAGANEYVKKPVENETLKESINKVLTNNNLHLFLAIS